MVAVRAAGQGLTTLAVGLESAGVDVRRRAVAAIAAVRTAEATTHLRRALEDSDAVVRSRAALALGARGSIDAIPDLLEMVFTGQHDVEAAEVLGVLTEVSHALGTILDRMQATLDNSNDPPTRLRITQALAEIPGPEAHEALTRLAHDHDRTIAATAAAIMTTQERKQRQR